jgi:hypothetical protein
MVASSFPNFLLPDPELVSDPSPPMRWIPLITPLYAAASALHSNAEH